MTPIFDQYHSLLWQMFRHDINVFSKPWLYYGMLVPAIGCLIFFFAKWTVLTTPILLPLSVIPIHSGENRYRMKHPEYI